MRSIARPACVVCGSQGRVLQANLSDRLYAAPGAWTMKRCEGPGCGTLWLDPAPHPEDLGEAYAQYFTHDAGGAPRLSGAKRAYLEAAFGAPGRRSPSRRMAAFLFALRFRRRGEADDQICHVDLAKPAQRVLDIGCGDGRTLWSLRELGCDGVGVEFDPAAVARGRERGLDIRQGSLHEQGFPPESFDAVILSHVIEHLPDPLGVLRECHRVLRRGGQLRMLTPNAAAWGHRHFGRDWFALDPPRHLNIFTPSSLADLMRQAGFADARVPTTPTGADRIAVYSRRIAATGRAEMDEPFGWSEKRIGRVLLLWEALLDVGGRGIASQLVAKGSKTG